MDDPATEKPPETPPPAAPDPALLQLVAAVGHRSRGIGDLLRDGTDLGDLLSPTPALLKRCPGVLAKALAAAPGPARLSQRARELARALSACNAGCLSFTDPRYPQPLRDIPDPPPWLFYRGDAAQLSGPCVAVVGSRRASHAGRTLASGLCARLAEAGYRVCSGMALGIDAAAHRGALERGSTIAVLGTGIDECYPRSHEPLLQSIVARGCVVSELAPGTAAHRGQFPRRNRIISGLATATVIVEAALPSGSLHTAAAALEQGRDVYVMPWSLLHRGGAGCLSLLRDGAIPLTSLEELDDHFPPLAAGSEDDEDPDARLLSLLGDSELGLQALLASTALPPAQVLAALGRLEARGAVERRTGGYARRLCKSCMDTGSC